MQPDRQESLQERGLLSSNSEQAVIVSGGILVIAKDAGSVWRCEEDTGLLFLLFYHTVISAHVY
jgi:hypothetical protein